jgi:glycosyltransferase involved in cell wall biosynthesis
LKYESKKKVVFVSSAQPYANPRLVKEAKSLLQAGYFVSVIWCPISPWADDFDHQLFDEFQEINWVNAGYHSEYQPLGYWFARIRQKIWQIIYKLIGNHFDAAIKSFALYSQELTSIALQQKADLFIGHNLGALPSIVKAAKKHKATSIFDFEDFHRGEAAQGTLQTKMVKEIENHYIPLVSSITSASVAITSEYQYIFSDKQITTINNCFPVSYAAECTQELPDRPLKLFWFSQHVGKQRGLQTVIKAMSNFAPDEITLTLLGKSTDEVKEYFYELMDKVGLNKSLLVFLDPVQESEIAQIAAKHHVGLSAEYVHIANRDLCLTNKLFMYLLAGNAIVATDTSAQKSFLEDNQVIGSIYVQEDAIDLSHILNNYIDDPELLDNHRKNALELGKTKYNWDIEKKKFLQIVEKVLAK